MDKFHNTAIQQEMFWDWQTQSNHYHCNFSARTGNKKYLRRPLGASRHRKTSLRDVIERQQQILSRLLRLLLNCNSSQYTGLRWVVFRWAQMGRVQIGSDGSGSDGLKWVGFKWDKMSQAQMRRVQMAQMGSDGTGSVGSDGSGSEGFRWVGLKDRNCRRCSCAGKLPLSISSAVPLCHS